MIPLYKQGEEHACNYWETIANHGLYDHGPGTCMAVYAVVTVSYLLELGHAMGTTMLIGKALDSF